MDKILIVAFITEAIWETLKMVRDPKGINMSRIAAMILGILIALASGIDIFEILGIKFGVRFLGSIFTGLLISRGSNLVHDLLGSISSVYQNNRKAN